MINENWQMVAYVLETCSVPGQHTADNIYAQLIRITEQWGITDKILAVVTDNGGNMVAAVRRMATLPMCYTHFKFGGKRLH